ncbi:MAG: histidine phosphatase family protein [bacterium]
MNPERVVVWRHGRTTWNAERRFQGQADPPLDDVGQAQAAQAAALLALLNPALILTSDLRRAEQTAAALAMVTGVSPRPDDRLRERSLGRWEGLTRDEVAGRYPSEFEQWISGRDVPGRGGESREQVARRARAAFDDLPAVGLVVVVTHSATAMALTSDVVGLGQALHILGPLANCHWTELQSNPDAADGGGWRIRAHNAGPPGVVVPFAATDAESPDADAIDAESTAADHIGAQQRLPSAT